MPHLTQAFSKEVTEVSSRPDGKLWARLEFLTSTLPLFSAVSPWPGHGRPPLSAVVGSVRELSVRLTLDEGIIAFPCGLPVCPRGAEVPPARGRAPRSQPPRRPGHVSHVGAFR